MFVCGFSHEKADMQPAQLPRLTANDWRKAVQGLMVRLSIFA